MPPTEPLQPLSPPPRPAEPTILFGPLGLRAGWGILLYLLLAGLLATVLVTGLFKVTGRSAEFQQWTQQARAAANQAQAEHRPASSIPFRASITLISEAAQAAAVLLAALALSFIERRRFAVYGLPLRRIRDLLPGALSGLGTMSLLIGLLYGSHTLVFGPRMLSGSDLLRFAADWLIAFIVVGLFEEFCFRGYLQYTLTRGLLGLGQHLSERHAREIAFWITSLLLSTAFFSAHAGNAGETPAGLAAVFLAGIVFSYALWRTGSLWWGIGFHATWDWAQSFLYGVPDSGTIAVGRLFSTHPSGRPLLSGGVAGPEGSILVIPVLLLVALLVRLHPQASQPPLEPKSIPGEAGHPRTGSIL